MTRRSSFRTEPSLAFPPSNIAELRWEGEAAHMIVTFMGLTGPAGVLPRCYSAFLLSRLRERDRTLADFLDLFNHRFISLFYRAWEKYRFGVVYERDGADRVSRYLTCLVGLGTPGLQDRLGDPGRAAAVLYRAPLAASPLRHRAGATCWRTISTCRWKSSSLSASGERSIADDQCGFSDGDSYSEQLGVAAVAGDAMWDQQSRIRLKLGPLTEEQYLSFPAVGIGVGAAARTDALFLRPEPRSRNAAHSGAQGSAVLQPRSG